MRFLAGLAGAAVLLALLAMPGFVMPGHAQSRVALVIGNGRYENAPPLASPGNDARDMAAALGRLGFSVQRVFDGNLSAMREALRDFTAQLQQAEMAVIYFSGHAMEIGVTVERRRAVLGGVGDQHAAGRLDADEPLIDRLGRQAAPHPCRERIVAAGIEDNEPEPRGSSDPRHNAAERRRLILGGEVADQPGIDRDQPVLAGTAAAVSASGGRLPLESLPLWGQGEALDELLRFSGLPERCRA